MIVGGRTIYNSDRQGYGNVDLTTFMSKSLNVIAAKVALATGAKTFYQYLHDFGLGSLSQVDLAGEIPGTVKNPGDGIWYESDLGTNSFGQGIAVTPLQMANAIAVVANGGNFDAPVYFGPDYSPRRVGRSARAARDSRVVETRNCENCHRHSFQFDCHRVFKQSATLPGYKIAGKTGTAQIPVPGGYDPKWTIASFGGYFPADNPQ